MKKLLLVSALVLVLSGCSNSPPAGGSKPATAYTRIARTSGPTTVVDRVIDRELGVVCYVSDGHYSGGIECLHYPELQDKPR